jgi:hypothetical protein
MKVHEIMVSHHQYLASVRVVINGTGSTARTTITADNQQQARLMLTRLYGVGNVLTISEDVSASPRTCEIRAQATFQHHGIERQRQHRKTGPIQLSCVSEAGADTRVLSPAELQVKSLADQATRLNQQAKVKKAETKLLKAQDKLRRASAAPKLSV